MNEPMVGLPSSMADKSSFLLQTGALKLFYIYNGLTTPT